MDVPDRVHVLQACIPSYHVCRSLVLPAPPQFLNQEPPRPQQLILPDCDMVPHLGHTEPLAVVVVSDGVFFMCIAQDKNNTSEQTSNVSIYMQSVLNLRLQATAPSNHLWSTFLLRSCPQFLNQAPPGAQQLTLPDFANMPHLGHAMVFITVAVMAGVMADVAIGVLTISSRSDIGRRDTYSGGA